MYKNQLSQHFTYIYSKRKLPGTHNMYRGDAVLSPPRNHGSILLGNKIYRHIHVFHVKCKSSNI